MKLNKTQKIRIGIGSGITLTAIVIGIKVHKNKKQKSLFEPNDKMYLPTSENRKKTTGFPLKFGDKNNFIKRFQMWVNRQAKKINMITGRNIALKEDGIFGKKTSAAAKLLLKSDKISKNLFDKYNM